MVCMIIADAQADLRLCCSHKLKACFVANFIAPYEDSQYNRYSHLLSEMCSLFPKATLYMFIIMIRQNSLHYSAQNNLHLILSEQVFTISIRTCYRIGLLTFAGTLGC